MKLFMWNSATVYLGEELMLQVTDPKNGKASATKIIVIAQY